jgi:hypothetical protein
MGTENRDFVTTDMIFSVEQSAARMLALEYSGHSSHSFTSSASE